MGDRAVIEFEKGPTNTGIYLHWNGGIESVKAFLDATRTLTASLGPDPEYRPARLIQVIGNFLGGSLSLGIGDPSRMDTDNGDNGTYIVDAGTLEIVGRKFVPAHNPDANFDQVRYEEVLAKVIERNSEPFSRA